MKKSDITAETFPKYTPDPLLEDLPAHLKDPANYVKVQKVLLETLATKHSHPDVMEWFKCAPCMGKLTDHKNLMIKLGFKTPAHYLAWKRTHEHMKKRVPLIDFK